MIISGKCVVVAESKMEYDGNKKPVDALTISSKVETFNVQVEKELSKVLYTVIPPRCSLFSASSGILIYYHYLSFQAFVLLNFTYKACLIADQKNRKRVSLINFYLCSLRSKIFFKRL